MKQNASKMKCKQSMVIQYITHNPIREATT